MTERRVAECAMRDQQLMRGECTRVGRIDRWAGTEEGHLKAERFAGWSREPAGGVPPLRAKVGMAAQVARKLDRAAGCDGCVWGLGNGGGIDKGDGNGGGACGREPRDESPDSCA